MLRLRYTAPLPSLYHRLPRHLHHFHHIPPPPQHSIIRPYSKRRGKKKSYRVKEAEHRHWLEHVQLTDEKYDIWTKEFEQLTSERLVDEDIAMAIEGMHDKFLRLRNEKGTEEKEEMVQNNEIPFVLTDEYRAALVEWIKQQQWLTIRVPKEQASNGAHVGQEQQVEQQEEEEEEEELTLFFENDGNGNADRLHPGLLQVFLHSSYIVHHGDYKDSAEMQTLLSKYSMEELSKIGSEFLDSMATHFITYAMYPSSRSKFLQIASPRYDLQPYEYTSFDIIDYQNVAMENVQRAKKSLIDPRTITMLSQVLGLHDHLLNEIGIVEAEEGQEAIAMADEIDKQLMDPNITANRRKRLENIRQATMPSNVAVFETDTETAMVSYREVIEKQLLEALLGAIQLHYGSQHAAAFFVQKLLPFVQDQLSVVDRTDYIVLLKTLLEKHKGSPEYRVDKRVIKRRKHRDIKVSVIVHGEELGYAFGETYSEAKYKAAKAVYLELEENPMRLEKIKHKLVNAPYIFDLARLLPA